MVEKGTYYNHHYQLEEGKSFKTNVRRSQFEDLKNEPVMYSDEDAETGTPKSLEKWRELSKDEPFDFGNYYVDGIDVFTVDDKEIGRYVG